MAEVRTQAGAAAAELGIEIVDVRVLNTAPVQVTLVLDQYESYATGFGDSCGAGFRVEGQFTTPNEGTYAIVVGYRGTKSESVTGTLDGETIRATLPKQDSFAEIEIFRVVDVPEQYTFTFDLGFFGTIQVDYLAMFEVTCGGCELVLVRPDGTEVEINGDGS